MGLLCSAKAWYQESDAHTDAYLNVAPANARTYAALRNQYVPGGQMWVTESGDAGGGGNPGMEGAHMYCHSRRDGKDGVVYLIINNSATDTTKVELPKEALRYTLTGNGSLRSRMMYLNGQPLSLGEQDELPLLAGKHQPAGAIELEPGSCTFLVV